MTTSRSELASSTLRSAHPPVWGGTQDVNVLAFTWGVIATWWVGAILGIPLALAARWGSTPTRNARQLFPSIAALFVAAGVCALLAGIAGYRAGMPMPSRSKVDSRREFRQKFTPPSSQMPLPISRATESEDSAG